ncbi:MAG: prepilin-type N-terminal cleavage/methylation domain-containing protein [Candidatus Zambryskibacteria bacterium]|nr:prepilin-type N-terminal cleavage/methylation domain-containing protein [Candidatus Zambryskibacteria bacterium]
MKNNGFTIIESLVAMAILLAAIAGASAALQTGISSYIFSKDQVIAFYLAQEGFEQVRNIRDENALAGRDWLTGLSDCFSPNSCTVSPVENSNVAACGLFGTCPVLRQDTQTGFFGYNALWPPTVLKREIQLEQINGYEVSILVTIDWSKGTASQSFRARENIFNWP